MEFIDPSKTVVEWKYCGVLCKLSHERTHPERSIETSLPT